MNGVALAKWVLSLPTILEPTVCIYMTTRGPLHSISYATIGSAILYHLF